MRVGLPTAVRETPAPKVRGPQRGDPRHLAHGLGVPQPDVAPATRHLLPGRVVLYAWLLAGIPIATLQAAHAGVHERQELPPLLHWLRDASLAVPFAALAVIVAALLVMQARPAGLDGRVSIGAAALLGFAAAGIFALLAIPLAQVHGLLFGAEDVTGMTPLQHAVTEGISVFQVAVLLVPVVLLAGVPWRGEPSDARRAARRAASGPREDTAFGGGDR